MFPPNTKILIVDDMKTMRLMLRKFLADLGFTRVTDVEDGDVAWVEFQKAAKDGLPYELIISDWVMPKTKGIHLLNRVRGASKKLPFIMLTGENEGESIREAVTAGVSAYVLKPFDPEGLRQKLEAVYQASQAAQSGAKKSA